MAEPVGNDLRMNACLESERRVGVPEAVQRDAAQARGRHVTLDEIIAGIENATAADVQRVAGELFMQDTVGVTVLGPAGPAALDFTRLAVA